MLYDQLHMAKGHNARLHVARGQKQSIRLQALEHLLEMWCCDLHTKPTTISCDANAESLTQCGMVHFLVSEVWKPNHVEISMWCCVFSFWFDEDPMSSAQIQQSVLVPVS